MARDGGGGRDAPDGLNRKRSRSRSEGPQAAKRKDHGQAKSREARTDGETRKSRRAKSREPTTDGETRTGRKARDGAKTRQKKAAQPGLAKAKGAVGGPQQAKPREPTDDETRKTPKAFVVVRGSSSPMLRSLRDDMREMMLPWVAQRLKEKRRNTLKDFTEVAGALHVTHLFTLSQGASGVQWRIMRLPRGPTITFRIDTYSAMKDLRKLQRKFAHSERYYRRSPVVVLSGFRNVPKNAAAQNGKKDEEGGGGPAAPTGSKADALKIASATLQHLFPSVDVRKANLRAFKRVLLFNYNGEQDRVEMRHYHVCRESYAHNPLREIKKRERPAKAAEDADDPRDGPPRRADDDFDPSKVVLRLTELGPRIDMSLVKVQDGVGDGNVLYMNR